MFVLHLLSLGCMWESMSVSVCTRLCLYSITLSADDTLLPLSHSFIVCLPCRCEYRVKLCMNYSLSLTLTSTQNLCLKPVTHSGYEISQTGGGFVVSITMLGNVAIGKWSMTQPNMKHSQYQHPRIHHLFSFIKSRSGLSQLIDLP